MRNKGMVLSGKRAKREADSTSTIRKDEDSDLTSRLEDKPKEHHQCRFCDKTFGKSQALGGHMNKHRAEKEEEGLKKARSLIESKQQIHYGSIPWPSYAGSGGGAETFGQNLSSNLHIVGTSTTPQSYCGNQSAPSLQQNQIQMNQPLNLPLQQIQGQGDFNVIRGSHLRSSENTRLTHHSTPTASHADVNIVTGQPQAHPTGAWVNPGQMAYTEELELPNFHAQLNPQLHQQAPPPSQLQSLQDMAAQSASNAAMASAYSHQYLQEHQSANMRFVELAQLHRPAQHYYEVAHPHRYHFNAPQDHDSQTSIDDNESLRNHDLQSPVGMGDISNQTLEHGDHHRTLHKGTTTEHHGADPGRES